MRHTLNSIISKIGIDRFKTIYDIGANKGQWVKQVKPLLPNARFICFEANNHKRPNCLSPKDIWLPNHVLSNVEKEIDFYQNNGTGDSYYKENSRFYHNTKGIRVKTKTLVSARKGMARPNMIKLDTQGSELDILEGGRPILGECLLLKVEVPIFEYNEGSPRFQDYIDYITSLGFVPIEIDEIHYCSNILNQLDILFVNRKEFENKFEDKNRVLVRDLIK